ncbi:FAD-linked oxidoreductase-like protein [Dactylonectria macrodidyma]|uniref:Proline dehydrogenase n=1 Tax=Dactylonectria macrodidyma TaxID=307937 RepID=A0A9P9IHC3_9HYPO|nr:FAD-linked oxidoreductase-like protein [Dactylonectria macrodidyma]
MYIKSLTRSVVKVSTGPLLVLASRHGNQRGLLSGTTSSTPQGTKSIPAVVTLPPHSLLPTNILWRSLLIATVSSHRALSAPSLAVLSFLSQPRSTLSSIEKNPVLYVLFKKTMYNYFCAGENEREVTSTIRGIKDMGFKGVILTYAREVVLDALTEEEIAIGAPEVKAEPDSSPSVSVDQVEVSSDESIEAWRSSVLETVRGSSLPEHIMLALQEVCEEAIRRKAKIFINAKQQFVQPGIDSVAMKLMKKYNRGGKAIIYNTYQAYLKCIPDALHKHLHQAQAEGFLIGVKLVRGAYINSEPRHLINDTEQVADDTYNHIAMELLSGRYRHLDPHGESRMPAMELFLATHSQESSLRAYEI